MKTIPAGDYIFNKTLTSLPTNTNLRLSPGGFASYLYGTGLSSYGYEYIEFIDNVMTHETNVNISFGTVDIENMAHYLFTNYAPNEDVNKNWYTRDGASPIYTDDENKITQLRSVTFNSSVEVEDEFYNWFNNNIYKEPRPAVQLNSPYISIDKNFIKFFYIDNRATSVSLYYQKEDLTWQTFASISPTNYNTDFNISSYFNENTTTSIYAICDSNVPDYTPSNPSNIVISKRLKNASFTFNINGEGINHSVFSFYVDNVKYEKDRYYTNNKVYFDFIIPIYADTLIQDITIISYTKPNYTIVGESTENLGDISITSGSNIVENYTIKTVLNVSPYKIIVKSFSGQDILLELDNVTQPLLNISLFGTPTDPDVNFYFANYSEHLITAYLGTFSFTGLSETIANKEPEYSFGNSYDVNITSDLTLYVCYIGEGVGNYIYLYKNNSESNRLDKTKYLTSVGSAFGNFRDICDIINPVINIEYKKIPDFNYLYIPNFNRYYFVDKYEIIRTNIFRLYLHVDVLMSYKDGIKKLECLVLRNEYRYNKELNSKIPQTSKVNYEYIKIPLPSITNDIVFTNMDSIGYGVNSDSQENYGIPCFSLLTVADNEI